MLETNLYFDTNVLVYTFDGGDPRKRSIAQGLLRQAIRDGTARVGVHTIAETLNVLVHRRNLVSGEHAKIFADDYLWPHCRVLPGPELYADALRLRDRYQSSFWDGIALASARACHCAVMLSEDMQHGQTMDGVQIYNPFLT